MISLQEIKITEFTLNNNLVNELRIFTNFVRLDHIKCSYITNKHADEIISTLSSAFKEIILVGSFSHSNSFLKLVDTHNILFVLEGHQNTQRNLKVADFLAAILCQNFNTEESDSEQHQVPTCHAHNPYAEDAAEMTECLHYINDFSIENYNMSDKVADEIATVLLHIDQLQKINLINLQTKCIIRKILNNLQDNSSLTVINLKGNNIEGAADDLAVVLSHNTKLEVLNLNQCNLHKEGVIKIAKALQNTSSLVEFNMHGNNIGDKAADEIAIVLFQNKFLQNLNLDETNLQTVGTIKIAKSLQNNRSLISSGNYMGDEAADDIATILSLNSKLQSINLSQNNLQTEGTKNNCTSFA